MSSDTLALIMCGCVWVALLLFSMQVLANRVRFEIRLRAREIVNAIEKGKEQP